MGEFVAISASPQWEFGSGMSALFSIARTLSGHLTPVTRGADRALRSDLEDRSATFGTEAGLQVLDNLYRVSDSPRVHGFIRRHQWLVEPLLTIYEELLRRVDVRGPIILEYVADPEEDFDCLAVTVSIPGTPRGVLAELHKVDEWWLVQPSSLRSAVVLSLVPA